MPVCLWVKAIPILLIHDVGAGGLSNALPELVKDAGVGGRFELRKIPSADRGMTPLEIWCNEAQERYVLGVDEAQPCSSSKPSADASDVPTRWWARRPPISICSSKMMNSTITRSTFP